MCVNGAGRKVKRVRACVCVWGGVGYLCVIQLLPLGCDEVEDAVEGPGEGYPSDQQDDQHYVGERGCEIHHLSREETRMRERGKVILVVVIENLRFFREAATFINYKKVT